MTSKISIHAPRVGRDNRSIQGCHQGQTFQSTRPVWGATFTGEYDVPTVKDFNPRAPCGARRGCIWCALKDSAFQSTRPVWGATFDNLLDATGYPISIHAPRVGRDTTVLLFDEFQSISIHAPRVGRDLREQWAQKQADISIHAPRVGRDEYGYGWGGLIGISIHAPRVGRDKRNDKQRHHCKNFNPRAPCGARRRLRAVHAGPHTHFNPRAPCGARHCWLVLPAES